MARTIHYVSSSGASGAGAYAAATSEGSPCDLATARDDAVAGDDVAIKKDGTYTLAANFIPVTDGSVTQPIRWIGYRNTLGDGYAGRQNGKGRLVPDNMPVIDVGTSYQIRCSDFNIFDAIYFLADRNATVINLAAANHEHVLFLHCVCENISIGASAKGFEGESETDFVDCDCYCVNSTDTNQGCFIVQARGLAAYCRAETSASMDGFSINGAGAVVNCTVVGPGGSPTGSAVYVDGANAKPTIVNVSAYGVDDVIRYQNAATSDPTSFHNIVAQDCAGKVFQNDYSGTADVGLMFSNIRYRSVTGGMGDINDHPTDHGQLVVNDTTDYFVDGANGDMRLLNTAGAVEAGPTLADVGAIQRRTLDSGSFANSPIANRTREYPRSVGATGASLRTLDATSEKVMAVVVAPKTGTIDRIVFSHDSTAAGASRTLDCRLETVTSGEPSGTLLNGSDSNVAIEVNTLTVGIVEVTLDGSVSVTAGDEFAIVLNCSAGTWGTAPDDIDINYRYTFIGTYTHRGHGVGYQSTGTNTWTTGYPGVSALYDDDDPVTDFLHTTSAGGIGFNTGDADDNRGGQLVLDEPVLCHGVEIELDAAGTTTGTIRVWHNGTNIATSNIDTTRSGTGSTRWTVSFAQRQMSAGDEIVVMVEAGDTTDLLIYEATAADGTYFGSYFQVIACADNTYASAKAGIDTTKISLSIALLVSQINGDPLENVPDVVGD